MNRFRIPLPSDFVRLSFCVRATFFWPQVMFVLNGRSFPPCHFISNASTVFCSIRPKISFHATIINNPQPHFNFYFVLVYLDISFSLKPLNLRNCIFCFMSHKLTSLQNKLIIIDAECFAIDEWCQYVPCAISGMLWATHSSNEAWPNANKTAVLTSAVLTQLGIAKNSSHFRIFLCLGEH